MHKRESIWLLLQRKDVSAAYLILTRVFLGMGVALCSPLAGGLLILLSIQMWIFFRQAVGYSEETFQANLFACLFVIIGLGFFGALAWISF